MDANELRYDDSLGLNRKKAAAPLPEDRSKALLVGMIGAGKMPIYANTLTTGLSFRKVRETLFWEWGIHDIKTARQIIEWSGMEGSRELYRKYYPFIGSSATAGECRRKAVLSYSPDAYHKYIIHPFTHSIHSLYRSMDMMQGHPDFAFTPDNLPPDIIAWDMARLIWLVRLCFDCGYLDGEDAWDHILDADRRIWKHYGNIRQFFMGCLAGCAFLYGGQKDFTVRLALMEKWLLLQNECSTV